MISKKPNNESPEIDEMNQATVDAVAKARAAGRKARRSAILAGIKAGAAEVAKKEVKGMADKQIQKLLRK